VAHYPNENVFNDCRNLLFVISPPLSGTKEDCSTTFSMVCIWAL